jgi:hypothetical protein
MGQRLLVFLGLLVGMSAPAFAGERSFWLHASLGLFTQRNYFGADYPGTSMPTEHEIGEAARVLTGTGINRLYLIYHREVSLEDGRRLFRMWQKACSDRVELVPALVLRMYDRQQTEIFNETELVELAEFFRQELNPERIAVYDIAPNRDLKKPLRSLGALFPSGVIRLGLQPEEGLESPFKQGVADTWSALCHGKRHEEDWNQPGFGAESLRRWVLARNTVSPVPIAWNLVTVAWDYAATPRGGYPGYDDAKKNAPLPEGRNRRAVRLIRETADARALRGFSSDLYILQENSRSVGHDGRKGSFYECLKRGEEYRGYYGKPFQEIVELFQEMSRSGE